MEYNNKLESTMMLAVTFEAGVGHLAQALRGGRLSIKAVKALGRRSYMRPGCYVHGIPGKSNRERKINEAG